jgi:eukaryotic-like serine/threonine-protein kinase
MDHRLRQAALSPFDQETVQSPEGAEARAKVSRPRREIVAGSGPHLTDETRVLLRSRLRAAASMLLLGFGVFLVRHVVGVLSGEPLDPALLGLHVLVVLVLGFSALPLWRHCALSLRKLRLAELVIFGLPAVFFLALQHRATLSEAARNYLPPPMPFWLLLIFTYTMFIPNTWRRAALVIGAMALAPDLLVLGMVLAYPEVAALLTPMAMLQYVLQAAQGPTADAQDHRAVPPNDFLEGLLVPRVEEGAEQLAVASSGLFPAGGEGPDQPE